MRSIIFCDKTLTGRPFLLFVAPCWPRRKNTHLGLFKSLSPFQRSRPVFAVFVRKPDHFRTIKPTFIFCSQLSATETVERTDSYLDADLSSVKFLSVFNSLSPVTIRAGSLLYKRRRASSVQLHSVLRRRARQHGRHLQKTDHCPGKVELSSSHETFSRPVTFDPVYNSSSPLKNRESLKSHSLANSESTSGFN